MCWKSYLSHQIYHLMGKKLCLSFGHFLAYKSLYLPVRIMCKHTPFHVFLLCPSPTRRKPITWAKPSRWTQMEPQLLPTDLLVWITGLINISTFFFFYFNSHPFSLFFLDSLCFLSSQRQWNPKLISKAIACKAEEEICR